MSCRHQMAVSVQHPLLLLPFYPTIEKVFEVDVLFYFDIISPISLAIASI